MTKGERGLMNLTGSCTEAFHLWFVLLVLYGVRLGHGITVEWENHGGVVKSVSQMMF